MNRAVTYATCALWGLLVWSGAAAGRAQPPARAPRLAVVADGPSDSYDRATRILKEELTALLGKRLKGLRLPARPTHVGDYSARRARALVREVLADPAIDVVVGLGLHTGRALGSVEPLPKPVFLPFAHVKLQDLPRDGARSGRHNLAYLTGLVDLERELRRFREVIRRERAVLVVDAQLVAGIPRLDAYVREVVGDTMQVRLVRAGATAARILSALPKDAQAVYLGPLLQLPDAQVPALLAGLNERGLPSYASEGRDWVEKGAFVSLVPAGEERRRLRKVALHIEEALEGRDPGDMDTTFAPRAQLVINMHTARQIQVWPRFELLTEAELVGGEAGNRGTALTLRDAVATARKANLDLRARRRDVDLAQQDLRSAKGELAPTLAAEAQFTWLDKDVVNPLFNSERTLEAKASAEQVLYSPAAVGALRAQRHNLKAAERGVASAELDVVLAAAEAYLNVLRARTAEEINRSFLKRVRRNLSLAEVRVEIGASGRQDVFRWQAEMADARANVIAASAARNQAEIALNRVLNRPLEAPVRTVEPANADTGILLDERLREQVGDPWSFRVFRDFMVQEAVGRAPELARLDQAIAAQEQVLKALRARLFLPDVLLRGGLSRVLDRSGVGEEAPPSMGVRRRDASWQVGVGLRLTLFDQTRYAGLDKARAQLAQLRTQRASVAQQVEQRVRVELHSAGFTSAAMRLRQDAAEAARKNLALVTDAYRQGAVNIITLIDAQNQALASELSAANAVYDFLIDFVQVERASGRFGFLADEADRAAFYRRLAAFRAQRRAAPGRPEEGSP